MSLLDVGGGGRNKGEYSKYILMLQKNSLASCIIFEKVKHDFIIIGCRDIHWNVYLLFQLVSVSVDISACDKPVC